MLARQSAHALACLTQVVVTGTVVRAGSIKMLACQQLFECTRCGLQFPVKCKLEDGGKAVLPDACPRGSRPCAGVKFRPVPNAAAFTGFQEIKVAAVSGWSTWHTWFAVHPRA